MAYQKAYKFLASIIICQMAGLIGSIFTTPQINTWYKTLTKPSIAPPNWIFGPVWTLLFVLMGISLFIIWNQKSKPRLGILFFIAQLALNIFWSVLFFGLQNPYWALVEIVFLFIFIVLTIWRFWKKQIWAGLLLIPYAAWVAFATVLNFLIWRINY
ncbi:MAG TPA: TspO/MBR family protein [Patescibacteria group bacterium]|nr:TspO/MBR family protein [Patescibacteria group bacterium]